MTSIVAVLLLVAVGALPAQAGRRADCRRACGARIAACQAATAGYGTLAGRCAKAVLKQCVKAGVAACAETTTTTTTSPATTTTTFPLLATGQMACWDASGVVVACGGTGQDGEIRAGVQPAYRDDGDGTIADLNTGLVWEKLADDGSIHDEDATYPWQDAFLKIAALNTPPCFAGHCDWRLPNRRELESLVDAGTSGPSIPPVFDRGCVPGCTVLTGSCTRGDYWSSSTYHSRPEYAWEVSFKGGHVSASNKTTGYSVRAVRGGAPLRGAPAVDRGGSGPLIP